MVVKAACLIAVFQQVNLEAGRLEHRHELAVAVHNLMIGRRVIRRPRTPDLNHLLIIRIGKVGVRHSAPKEATRFEIRETQSGGFLAILFGQVFPDVLTEKGVGPPLPEPPFKTGRVTQIEVFPLCRGPAIPRLPASTKNHAETSSGRH
ncbi:hypothetical protein GCM10008955_05970 [Deinococcus malanensis]|uniref:Secreted protein n=1 Tax=Deinococcus malanensis TaxID=1706855 RepID=A0ABQ2EKG6_9DEIO|nr:hypothetical protein GCM10008955_05970 [Deinococcus malanensis]